jgi:hypothetical protein
MSDTKASNQTETIIHFHIFKIHVELGKIIMTNAICNQHSYTDLIDSKSVKLLYKTMKKFKNNKIKKNDTGFNINTELNSELIVWLGDQDGMHIASSVDKNKSDQLYWNGIRLHKNKSIQIEVKTTDFNSKYVSYIMKKFNCSF